MIISVLEINVSYVNKYGSTRSQRIPYNNHANSKTNYD